MSLASATNGNTTFAWITEVLKDLDRIGRQGLVMEVRFQRRTAGREVIVSVFDEFSPEEFERYKGMLNLKIFRGKIEYHYGGGGGLRNMVRMVTPLTEEEYRKMGKYSIALLTGK